MGGEGYSKRRRESSSGGGPLMGCKEEIIREGHGRRGGQKWVWIRFWSMSDFF